MTYYYVVSASVLGCNSTNSTFVSAIPMCLPPPAPIADNNGPIWAGMTLNLTATTVPGATYNWSGPNGFVSTNQNPSITNASVSDSGLFNVTATVGGCVSVPAATLVTVNPLPGLSIHFLDGNMVLDWPTGILQSATNLTGPWSDVVGAMPPRHTNLTDASSEFYRLKIE